MTLANELEQAWRTMEAGDTGVGFMRSLADFGVHDSNMMLAIEDGCRELLFPVIDDLALGNHHRTRGVKVVIRTQGVGASMRRYLVLRCTNPDFHGVFRRFAGAVLEQVSTNPNPARASLDAIRNWQEMFNRAGAKSEAMLVGLFGELHELCILVKRNPKALRCWTGPDARPQDFINGSHALEVKATRMLANEVEIHGLEQLWASPYEQLVLVVKQIVTDSTGVKLADIVAELLKDGVSASDLYERLEAFDLDAQQLAEPEMPRFTHRGSRYFLVTKDAP
ncbi:MAG TPA: PD-(D/E)XK motif protein, partial [Polyangium sp.]|nr:PD-(D/E)XK motif protein [Polyangium sp.]